MQPAVGVDGDPPPRVLADVDGRGDALEARQQSLDAHPSGTECARRSCVHHPHVQRMLAALLNRSCCSVVRNLNDVEILDGRLEGRAAALEWQILLTRNRCGFARLLHSACLHQSGLQANADTVFTRSSPDSKTPSSVCLLLKQLLCDVTGSPFANVEADRASASLQDDEVVLQSARTVI